MLNLLHSNTFGNADKDDINQLNQSNQGFKQQRVSAKFQEKNRYNEYPEQESKCLNDLNEILSCVNENNHSLINLINNELSHIHSQLDKELIDILNDRVININNI